MKTEIDQGKRLAAAIAERRRRSSPLPEHVRAEAMAYMQHRLTQGASPATVARELGVTAMSVSRWQSIVSRSSSKGRRREQSATPLRRVRVVHDQDTSPCGIVVTTAQGLRVEGLGVDQVIAVLRAIG